MNYVTFSFCLGNMMCHTFLLRERESGGELGQIEQKLMLTLQHRDLHKFEALVPKIISRHVWDDGFVHCFGQRNSQINGA